MEKQETTGCIATGPDTFSKEVASIILQHTSGTTETEHNIADVDNQLSSTDNVDGDTEEAQSTETVENGLVGIAANDTQSDNSSQNTGMNNLMQCSGDSQAASHSSPGHNQQNVSEKDTVDKFADMPEAHCSSSASEIENAVTDDMGSSAVRDSVSFPSIVDDEDIVSVSPATAESEMDDENIICLSPVSYVSSDEEDTDCQAKTDFEDHAGENAETITSENACLARLDVINDPDISTASCKSGKENAGGITSDCDQPVEREKLENQPAVQVQVLQPTKTCKEPNNEGGDCAISPCQTQSTHLPLDQEVNLDESTAERTLSQSQCTEVIKPIGDEHEHSIENDADNLIVDDDNSSASASQTVAEKLPNDESTETQVRTLQPQTGSLPSDDNHDEEIPHVSNIDEAAVVHGSSHSSIRTAPDGSFPSDDHSPAPKENKSSSETNVDGHPPVRIKPEPVDGGYDHALTGGHKHAPSHALVSKAANRHRTKQPEVISSTVRKEGKKKVRVTVVKGDWRTPKDAKEKKQEKKKKRKGKELQLQPKNLVVNNIKQEPVSDCEGGQDEAALDPFKKSSDGRLRITLVPVSTPASLSKLCTTRTRSRKISKPQRYGVDVVDEEEEQQDDGSGKDSAVPTALFRNAHIKTEPLDGYGDVQDRERPDTEGTMQLQQATEDQQKDKDSDVMVMRKCSVKLDQMPSDIVTTGMVNLKADPKILRDAFAVSTKRAYRKRPRDSNRPHACDQCEKTFIQRSHLTQHKKVHIGIKDHHCLICGTSFMYKSTLTTHLRFYHGGEKNYKCTICEKAFSYKSHLDTHMQRHYDERPFTCPICHKQYGAYYIVTHMKTHNDERMFACSVCGMKLKSKNGLEMHELIHDGRRPWKCKQCNSTFPYKTSLMIHERMHRGERPYHCDKCPAKFSQSTHLRTHLKGVHKIANPPTCTSYKKLYVKRVTTQKFDDGTQDAILLMRRAMSKAAAERKAQEQAQQGGSIANQNNNPAKSAMANTNNNTAKSAIANTNNNTAKSAMNGSRNSQQNTGVKRKRQSAPKHQNGKIKQRRIKEEPCDDYVEGGEGSGMNEVSADGESSDNMVVRLDFQKRRKNLRRK